MELRVTIALAVGLREVVRQRGIERGGFADALRAAKTRQHRAFVGSHRKEAEHERAQQDVGGQAQSDSSDDFDARHSAKVSGRYF
ncbi:MAG TPA: hypothetical protein VFI76_08525 [Terrimicrobiaceae bacterium]|nr:hypothetical protein [Terrimicrobiaceae bacterium]